MERSSFSSVDSRSPSSAKGNITIKFIIVNKSLDGSKPSVLSLKTSLHDLVDALMHALVDEFSPEARIDLVGAIASKVVRSLSTREADHIFVCVVVTPNRGFEFNVMTGIHVDEDKVVSWDLAESNFNPVLQACKPPIPCLKKVKINEQNFLGSNKEELSCAICLQDFPLGSEAATTTCSHMYHCHCIVNWLLKSTSCPLCRFSLSVG